MEAAKASSTYVSPREAAEILGAKLRTFREWVYRGQIDAVRTPGGRYLLERQWAEELKQNVKHLPTEITKPLGLGEGESSQ